MAWFYLNLYEELYEDESLETSVPEYGSIL